MSLRERIISLTADSQAVTNNHGPPQTGRINGTCSIDSSRPSVSS